MLFAPVGELVPVAMRALDQGGTLAVAGIHLSDVPGLNYADELFREKQLRSVTANTRADGEEFLRLAGALGVRPTVTPRPLDEADEVLRDLAADRVTGAAVLVPDQIGVPDHRGIRSMVSSTGRRGVVGSGGPDGAQPTRSRSCGDSVPSRTCSATTARVWPTSSGWLRGQVARPRAAACSSTALAASPARSRDRVSSEAAPSTSSSAPSVSVSSSGVCSMVPGLNRRAVPAPVPIGSCSRLAAGIPVPSAAPPLHSAVSVR